MAENGTLNQFLKANALAQCSGSLGPSVPVERRAHFFGGTSSFETSGARRRGHFAKMSVRRAGHVVGEILLFRRIESEAGEGRASRRRVRKDCRERDFAHRFQPLPCHIMHHDNI